MRFGVPWAVFLLLTLGTAFAERQSRDSHVPLAAKQAQPIGRLPGSQRLNLAIGLPLRDQEGLTRFLQQIYDTQNARFHQYLTPQQFAERFGPAPEDYQALMTLLRTNGFTVTATHPNRLLLDVSAPVTDIERTFGTTLRVYQHPSEHRTFYAPEVEPRLSNLPSILHISGLDNYLIPHPASLRAAPPQGLAGPMPQAGSGPAGAYRGSDFRGAYARAVSLNGSGQMVGLLEFDGYYPADIASYQSQASLPNVPLLLVAFDGFDGTPGTNNVEVALDIEMVSSMAPGLSQIILYEGGPGANPNDILNRMATDNLARQLSASWTYPIDTASEQIFLQFAAQGQTFFNSSGDVGAYTGAVLSPADEPNITIVGGTTLTTTGPGGAWVSETAWNWALTGHGSGATAGGISTTYPIPDWQKPVNMSTNHGSVTMRNLPDIAMVADNVWIAYNNGGSETAGGTSSSSPLWAGFMALVNQQAANFGRPPIGFLNPAIYALGLAPGYTTNFHDITAGNNTNSSSPTEFFAVPGYDLCTGWGSPFGQNLINALAPRIHAPVLTNVSATLVFEGCSPPNGFIDPGETVTVNFSLKNIGGLKTTNLIATLRADAGVIEPSAPQTYGAVTSGGSAVSRPFTFTANGGCGSTLNATLQLQDGPASLGSLSFTFPLGKSLIGFAQNFDTNAAPSLPPDWTTTASATGSNAVSVWVSSTTEHDTAPNAAFADEPPNPGFEDLLSPPIRIVTPSAQLSFRNNYNTEIDPMPGIGSYDGGVLEIQIGTNSFADILDAGGVFVAGGYNSKISTGTNTDNALKGHKVWGGNSGGFISTVVNLPASAAGQTIQLRWRFSLDTGNYGGAAGWYLDTVAIKDGASCCVSSADVAIGQSASPEPVAPGEALTYTVSVTNLGPGAAYEVVITNTLPSTVIFSSGSPGCSFIGGDLLCEAGTLAVGAVSNFTFSVAPVTTDPITNVIVAASVTSDPDLTNNVAVAISTVATNMPPIFFTQPADLAVALGGLASFQPAVFGVSPLNYQWLFNGAPLAGETAASLVLSNVQTGEMGGYSLVVTNSNGSTSSTVAHLKVLVPPVIQLTGFSPSATNLSISLESVSGTTYTLEYKNSLTDPQWIPILPSLPGTGGSLSLQDTNTRSGPTRFYRVNSR